MQVVDCQRKNPAAPTVLIRVISEISEDISEISWGRSEIFQGRPEISQAGSESGVAGSKISRDPSVRSGVAREIVPDILPGSRGRTVRSGGRRVGFEAGNAGS